MAIEDFILGLNLYTCEVYSRVKSIEITFKSPSFNTVTTVVQVNEYETAQYFIQLNQNLTSDKLSVDFCVFTCFYQFLHDVIIKLFWSAEQYHDHIMQTLVKTKKSTNNLMSIFGLIEENMELSHTHLAV